MIRKKRNKINIIREIGKAGSIGFLFIVITSSIVITKQTQEPQVDVRTVTIGIPPNRPKCRLGFPPCRK